MIQLQNVSLSFGGQHILDNLTWTLKPNQSIGLIGPNGAGKSTLLRVIAGRQAIDAGEVAIGGGTTVGFLEQDVQENPSDRSVREEALRAFDYILHLQQEEVRITAELEKSTNHDTPEYARLLKELEEVHLKLGVQEAHRIEDQTEAVLTGLGFDPDDLDRPLQTFSGGWRMRVALAKMLLQRPQFLLLDEPTNHLDIDSIDWLEKYLNSYAGTVVIVSHDRYFLDRMVRTTAELYLGKINEYSGNYSFYLEDREVRRTMHKAAYENQQKMIAETERFINRFRAKATKARQVQSRVKMLEKLERIPPPPSETSTIGFRFPEPEPSGRTVLEISRFSKTYHSQEGDIQVFKDAKEIMIERGDKIALTGKNGAGKSTLARILNGTEDFEGSRKLGYKVELTFFAQHQAETLHPKDTILNSLQAVAQGHSETELRTLLGTFLFTGDDVFKPIEVLSGGEKSRVALARTLLVPANFMILDEPTNHLDIQSIHVLIEALKQYSGSFVIVSHDRHFLDQVVNKVWRVGAGSVREFLGNYSEYQWQISKGTPGSFQSAPLPEEKPSSRDVPKRTGGPKTKEQKRREAEERKQRNKSNGSNPRDIKKQHAQLEKDIEQKEAEQLEIEQQLADPSIYENPEQSNALLKSYEAIKKELESLYSKWETVAEKLVNLDE